jgi:general stress protein CsbA
MSFWIDDPTILLNSKYIFNILPSDQQSTPHNLNALSRFVLLLTFFGYITLRHYMILILGFIILGVIVIYHSYKEGYENNDYPTKINTYLSPINPLGNTLMSDYKYNPTKKDSIEKLPTMANKTYGKTPSYESQYNSKVEDNINEKTKEFIYEVNKDNDKIKELFTDNGDQMAFEHQMRPFHTTPNTTIPNDQSSFLTYCYGILPSDKSIISY